MIHRRLDYCNSVLSKMVRIVKNELGVSATQHEQRRHLGDWGRPSPPRKKKKEKRKKKEKKKEKKKKKKEKKKKGTMNNVKLLHIKCCFSNFSIVRWH